VEEHKNYRLCREMLFVNKVCKYPYAKFVLFVDDLCWEEK
jgi:hypothetical protein